MKWLKALMIPAILILFSASAFASETLTFKNISFHYQCSFILQKKVLVKQQPWTSLVSTFFLKPGEKQSFPVTEGDYRWDLDCWRVDNGHYAAHASGTAAFPSDDPIDEVVVRDGSGTL